MRVYHRDQQEARSEDAVVSPLEPQPFVTEEGQEIERLRAELAAMRKGCAMTDTTNDIDALLAYMETVPRPDLRANLTALVAERNALREQLRLANIDQFNTEAEANDRERELRERLICAALTGILAHEGLDREFDCVIEEAIWMASKAISKMQEEKEGGGA